MTIGNDVVDLDDPQTRLDGLHSRWCDRVFAASERAALAKASGTPPIGTAAADSARHRLHWALWAAKESAYKARKRDDPRTVFSPREFVVELSPVPAGDGSAVGRVVHRGELLVVEVAFEGPCLHAVATSATATGERVPPTGRSSHALVVKAVATARNDPSRDVRQLAVSAIASALQLDPGRLRIAGRPPIVLHEGRPVDAGLSLSHHGRLVAFACTLAANGHRSRPRSN